MGHHHFGKATTMKFAIIAVVVAVFSCQVMGRAQLYNPFYQPAAAVPQFNAAPAVAPEVISEAEGLLLTTVRRTNELIDNLPPTGATGAEMAALWGAAYPQLRTLLAKSAQWAAQVPVPA